MPLQLLFTLAAGLAGGLIAKRLKLPGGLLVGAIIGAAALQVSAAAAYIPRSARSLAQMIAGAFSASAVTRDEVRKMPRVLMPALIVLLALLAVNLISALLIRAASLLEIVTCLFAMIPGSLQNTPLVAADYGADVSTVALLQLVRLLMGVGVLPAIIRRVSGSIHAAPVIRKGVPPAEKVQVAHSAVNALLTAAVALASGGLGLAVDFPGGALVFSAVGVMFFQISVGRAWLPRIVKYGAQILCGCYIGSMIGREELIRLSGLLMPALIAVLAYSAGCFLLGFLLNRLFGYSLGEGMLMGTPAGAADMLLIASDVGVSSSDLVLVHLIRMIFAVVVFPPLMGWISGLL